ncbi:phospholipase D-like domain-containing protein [Halovivax gelatinilyticus]|uniref:phospholipase D-like domain-containing protein n=1 Tax=Halovivax gelatinilyticus TaxID=2961597 RepID=UPI0020CA866B|nr:phospholipase D-like domain-containing protein [Halovivax gelatinilyticus]
MVQTFSIRSDQIARYLGSAFLNATRIVIVSPWVSDIKVKVPETDQIDDRELLLSQAVNQFDVNVTFVVDPANNAHNRLRAQALLPKVSSHATIETVDNLHAKAIVTDQILYQGSANVTYHGLNVNVELCDLRENEYEDANDFLRERIGLELGES